MGSGDECKIHRREVTGLPIYEGVTLSHSKPCPVVTVFLDASSTEASLRTMSRGGLKTTDCSSRRTGFNFQHPNDHSQLSVTPVTKDLHTSGSIKILACLICFLFFIFYVFFLNVFNLYI